jgi:hypothetical protein
MDESEESKQVVLAAEKRRAKNRRKKASQAAAKAARAGGAAAGGAVAGSGVDESDASSTDDELVAMMQFVGDKAGLKEARPEARRHESAVERNTRTVVEEHRRQAGAEQRNAARAALRDLTLKNMVAAAGSAWETVNAEEDLRAAEALQQDAAYARQLQGRSRYVPSEAEALHEFTSVVNASKELILVGRLEEAVAELRRGLAVSAAFPGKLLWSSTLRMSLGTTLVTLGRVREGMQQLSAALQLIRREPYTTFDSLPMQRQILLALVKAYEGLGKGDEASAWRDQLGALDGAVFPETASPMVDLLAVAAADAATEQLPKSLRESMDQALDAARRGQLGYLRALLHAFRQGRGAVEMRQVVACGHSETEATPLMVCAARGQLDLVLALLHAGAPVGQQALDGSTALDWAARFAQPDAVQMLLHAGGAFSSNVTADVMKSWSADVQAAVRSFVLLAKAEAQAQAHSTRPASPKAAQPNKTPEPMDDPVINSKPAAQPAIKPARAPAPAPAAAADAKQPAKPAPRPETATATATARAAPAPVAKPAKPAGTGTKMTFAEMAATMAAASAAVPPVPVKAAPAAAAPAAAGPAAAAPAAQPKPASAKAKAAAPDGKGAAPGEHELQKWDAAAQGQALEADAAAAKDWNQFEANKKLGVKQSGFDENLYTTALDVDSVPAELRAQAEALARGIEVAGSAEIDYAEDAMYSDVQRPAGNIVDDEWTDAAVLKRGKKKGPAPRK